MLAFFRRPRTQRLREYERQLAVQVTVFAIATISETERHDLNRRRPREPIDRSAPRERGADAIPPFVARVSRRKAQFAALIGPENEMRCKLIWPGLITAHSHALPIEAVKFAYVRDLRSVNQTLYSSKQISGRPSLRKDPCSILIVQL